MEILLRRKEEFVRSFWSGGSTTEFMVYPCDASYAGRDFFWRVSSAVVEAEESDFTLLPDFDRILMVLDGGLRLVHNGDKEVLLCEYEQDFFGGQWGTKSYGRAVDFNLMFRKGFDGFVECFNFSDVWNYSSFVCRGSFECRSEIFYALDSDFSFFVGDSFGHVFRGDLLVITGKAFDFELLRLEGEGMVVRATVCF